MRVLLVEDDQILSDGLARSLRHGGFAVDSFSNGDDADTVLTTQNYDLVILDLGLPGVSGIEVLKRMRARGTKSPVLILTAADSIEQRVRALDLGADDFVAKPFSLQELEARVRALVRRGAVGGSSILKHGPLSLDLTGRIASLEEQNLELSARELALLELLMQRSGRLVSKEQIVASLCEWGDDISLNAVEVYVHRLRKKLEIGGIKIATVRGLGYSLERPQTA